MYVVITGSSKGLGLALARRFLQAGDHVIISSRSQNRVDQAVEQLETKFPGRVMGTAADVTDYQSLNGLAGLASSSWGRIDIWINNAGSSGYDNSILTEREVDQIQSIVDTNLVGTLFGCRVALTHQCNQIFNVDGMGSDGRTQPGHTIYGATKRAIPYITKSLVKEVEVGGLQSAIHTISPGMVLTDLLIKNSNQSSRSVFNILAEQPHTVADFLVPRMRKLVGSNRRGEYIKFLTPLKVFWRFLTLWRYRNRFFDRQGNPRVELEGITIEPS